jgi:hypothetical protein
VFFVGYSAKALLSVKKTLGKKQIKKILKKIAKFFYLIPPASARLSPSKSQITAFFTQNSRLRGRRDSNP